MKIFNWKTREIIFEDSLSTIKETVENTFKQKVNLSNADLMCANLSNADLNYANLYNADLNYANLYNANLSNADLTYTFLYGTNLREAKLRDIDLEKLYFDFKKDRLDFNHVKEEILNHPNCSKHLTLKIKSIDLLS